MSLRLCSFLVVFIIGCGPQPSRIVNFSDSHVSSMSLSPNEELLATSSMSAKILVWDLKAKTKVAEFPGDSSVDFSPCGEYLLTPRGDEHHVTLWSIRDLDKSIAIRNPTNSQANCAKFFADSIHCACGYGDGWLRIWDYKTNREKARHFVSDPILELAVSPDNKQIAVGTIEGKIETIDVANFRTVKAWKGDGFLSKLEYSRDAKRLSSAGREFVVWNPSSGIDVMRLKIKDNITTFAWSSDEKLLATGGGPTVRVWQWGLEPRVILERRMRFNTSMAFYRNGRSLVVGGADRGNRSELLFLDL